MKTLVIHPIDRTTDFLEKVYIDLNADVIRGNVSQTYLMDKISDADRVYMLGHGTPQGLIGNLKLVVDHRHVEVLRKKKNLVGIWCNADTFFERYGLNGLYTGMIISEQMEADVFNVPANHVQISVSNVMLSRAIKKGLEVFDPEYAAPQVKEYYVEDLDNVETFYRTKRDNPVIEYNINNIYSSSICSGCNEILCTWADCTVKKCGNQEVDANVDFSAKV